MKWDLDFSSGAHVCADLASTPESHSRGLRGRTSLALTDGMLFVFPYMADHYMWMADVPFPLDFVFFDHLRRVVGIVDHVPAGSKDVVRIGTPSMYVLEVPAGWSSMHDIEVGDDMHVRPQ